MNKARVAEAVRGIFQVKHVSPPQDGETNGWFRLFGGKTVLVSEPTIETIERNKKKNGITKNPAHAGVFRKS